MNLPAEFISNVQNTFREKGVAFLDALPESIAEVSAQWKLTDVIPAPVLSYNFVAFAKRGGTDVVLKMGVPNNEMLSEMEALRLFNGEGACKLIEYDDENYWMLLERLHPGEMLVKIKDDDEATRIAADVMKKIWRRDFDTSAKFIKLSDWFNGLNRLRKMFAGGTGPLSEKLVQRVEGSVRELLKENHNPVLMHGDFHHYNILSSERGWLIIDPKGVIGPACYEVGPLLMNPWEELINGTNVPQITKRRIDILHEQLGFERERIREWTLSHAILSAWWGIEDNTGWEYSMSFAEMMADLQLIS